MSKVQLFHIFEFVLVAVCFFNLVYQSYLILKSYHDNPYASKCTLNMEDTMVFPKIRICPSDWIDRRSQDRMNISDRLLEYMLEVFALGGVFKRNYTDNDIVDLEQELTIFYKVNKISPQEYPKIILKRLKQPCRLMFQACRLLGHVYDCCSSNFGVDVWGHEGYCRDFGIVNSTFSVVQGVKAELGIGMGSLNKLRTRPSFVANKPSSPGATIGWTMEGRTPFLPDPYSVSPGSMTSIRLVATQAKRIHHCADSYADTEVLKPVNTMEDCSYACFVSMAAEICGCYLSGFDVIPQGNMSFCQPLQYVNCYRAKVADRQAKLFTECKSITSCKPPCKTVRYDTFLSSGQIDMQILRAVASNQTNLGNDFINDAWHVYLTTYVAITGITTFEEITTQTPYTLLSNVGGLVGLWLGLSIFSLGNMMFRIVIHSALVKRLLFRKQDPVQDQIRMNQTKVIRQQNTTNKVGNNLSQSKLRRYMLEL